MAAKQEIIDYIHELNSNQDISYNIYNALLYMIEDLKPRVKHLEFIKSSEFILMSKNAVTLWRAKGTRWAIVRGYVVEGARKGSYRYHILLNNETYEYTPYSSLLKAKEACQKHYEENILSQIEL